MKEIVHPLYKDYPEQPYISPDRDIASWVNNPELFPYGIVEKKQMQRLPEGILPGHIIMLWRIHFNNFTNATIIPQYFEYRYGVDSDACIETLINLGYIELCSAKDSLSSLSINPLKKILVTYNLETKGKKDMLIRRIVDNIDEPALEAQFSLRKYRITSSGEKLLALYDYIVQKHGPKM